MLSLERRIPPHAMGFWQRAIDQRILLPIILALQLALTIDDSLAGGRASEPQQTFALYSIGTVVKEGGRTFLVLDEKYTPGLMGLEDLSQITVVYWFHLNDDPRHRSILQVHPRANPANPLRGVFATRSPVRPNLIAISRCKIVSIDDNVVEIDTIDAFDGSPVLDIKN